MVEADDHGRKQQHREHDHERIADVRGEVIPRFHLGVQRSVALEHSRQNLLSCLNQALRPAGLLRLECSHFYGEFGGAFYVLQVDELPAFQLRAIGEVGVFGERVVLPASGLVDGGATPHAGRAIEVEEQSSARAAGVFEHEVTIEQDRLDLGQEGIMAVDVGPAGLHHADLGIGKVMDGAHQKIIGRSEVGVENRNEFALRRLQALGKRARFVAFTIRPVMVGDGIAQGRIAFDQSASHVDSFVSGIVEHLDVELILGIFELADRFQQAIDHVLFVEDGQLHRDPRQVFKIGGRVGRAVFPMLVIEIHQDIAMRSVTSQQNQHNEIRDQQRNVERVGVVESAKRRVEKMLADVRHDAALGGSRCGQLRGQYEIRS